MELNGFNLPTVKQEIIATALIININGRNSLLVRVMLSTASARLMISIGLQRLLLDSGIAAAMRTVSTFVMVMVVWRIRTL